MVEEQPAHLADFREAVLAGLSRTPKTLPCRFFYDFAGSQLFERICELPEYYLTRTEDALLRERAREIAARLPQGVTLVELGSGSSRKTRHLISALLLQQRALRYIPIDISHRMLEETAASLQQEFPRLEVAPLAGEYFDALDHLRRTAPHPLLLLFLGSNLGNFEAPDAHRFLKGVRAVMDLDDHALLGLDLKKDRATLESAYDDAQGVTAAFNLNLLARINRELGADFRLDGFQHRAVYRESHGRVEMHLVSRRAQEVHVAGRRFAFAAGETIHTENSHKYDRAEIRRFAADAGLSLHRMWTDERERFSVNLFRPVVD